MTPEDHKAIARRFFDLVNAGWPRAADEAAEAVITAPARDAFARVIAPFAEVEVTPDQLLAEGDVVVCRARLRGRHAAAFAGIPATGRAVDTAMAHAFRIAEGRIAECWSSWDSDALLRQLVANPGPAPELAAEPVLDVDEIQGNVLPGFGKDHAAFVLLDIADPAAARRWIARLAPQVATLREVHAFKQLFELTRRRRGFEGTVRATWLNVALGAGGLAKLGADPGAFSDAGFRAGMPRRAELLGDPRDPGAPGHASRWRFGGEATPDVLLIIASDDADDVGREVARQIADAAPALRLVHVQRGDALPPPLAGREPFGYADGISQPRPRGRLSDHDDDFLTPRDPTGELAPAQRGTGLIWPGELVLGYPSQGAAGAAGPASVGGPAWLRNGSFVVVRRLRQDVEGFGAFLRDAAAQLARDVPALRAMTPTRLGALMFGRWRSGAPLSLAPERDVPELGDDRARNNAFGFAASAVPCPYAAHIRRGNPRDDRPLDEVQRHRMLRRGIPFVDGAERGIVFVAYVSSIERQFELVTRAWINNPDLGAPGAGVDPLIGVGPAGRTFRVPVDCSGDGPVLRLPDWVTPTGGGYFFSPSISALAQLGAR